MRTDTPKTIYLRDYTPPDYLIDSVALRFDLGDAFTTVQSRLAIKANYDTARERRPLVLYGEGLELVSILLDGKALSSDGYLVDTESLTIVEVPGAFTLEIETRIKPQDNISLEGLYVSRGMYCTQCEAEGFRKITYYLDRPDVMASFSTTLIADKKSCPVLLSNGNLVDRGELEDGRHWVRWEDPYRKPSYLFALVAGRLDRLQDSYVTRSGRPVVLHIYVEPGNLDKCDHAMASLKNAMKWDEDTFGLEYDLDIYMIVAVDDFNMGAMENKGLNIFNTAYVLAKPETATDSDYEHIEGVIGHEYFHNWTGNRITCRDWFQLSLKEGLTVFRDQEFSADMSSRAVKRIDDVRALRARQFSEDAGPMAHSVRPDSYLEVNNFYTATVYEKGAEVVRMIHTLVRREGFRKGMDLYFQRHDGQAVTTDDFVQAMADANAMDLEQFKRWYSQAGTPELAVSTRYDRETRTYTMTIRQSCPPTPGQKTKAPFHVPLAVGLLDRDGRDLPLQLDGESRAPDGFTRILELREPEQSFRFINVPSEPVPSLLRGFSAPVKLGTALSNDDLVFLLAHDTDACNRWEAAQQLAIRIMQDLIARYRQGGKLELKTGFIDALRRTLLNRGLDQALIAEAMALPGEGYLADLMEVADPEAIHAVRRFVRRALAAALKRDLLRVYAENHEPGRYRFDAQSAGQRRLKNQCLSYLMELEEPELMSLCEQQFSQADNMTDVLGALRPLANTECPERQTALAGFYEKWKHEPLVVNKWLAIQAGSRLPGALSEVKQLLDHPAFEIKNPNKVRALIGGFCHGNPVRFHDASGAGYEFLAEQVLRLDAFNPQVAARLVGAFNRWRKYDQQRQELMQAQLQRIESTPELSKHVYEIVSKALG